MKYGYILSTLQVYRAKQNFSSNKDAGNFADCIPNIEEIVQEKQKQVSMIGSLYSLSTIIEFHL